MCGRHFVILWPDRTVHTQTMQNSNTQSAPRPPPPLPKTWPRPTAQKARWNDDAHKMEGDFVGGGGGDADSPSAMYPITTVEQLRPLRRDVLLQIAEHRHSHVRTMAEQRERPPVAKHKDDTAATRVAVAVNRRTVSISDPNTPGRRRVVKRWQREGSTMWGF